MSNKVAATWHPDSVFIAPVDAKPPRGWTWLDRLLRRDPMRGWEEAGWLEEALVSVDPSRDGGAVAHFTVRRDGSVMQNVRLTGQAADVVNSPVDPFAKTPLEEAMTVVRDATERELRATAPPGVLGTLLSPVSKFLRGADPVRYHVDPRGRSLPARARIDVEVWLTRGEMAQRLDDVRVAADREFQLGLFELEVATASYSEHVALTLAGFCLARDDIPAALAVLRGWARNPRRLP